MDIGFINFKVSVIPLMDLDSSLLMFFCFSDCGVNCSVNDSGFLKRQPFDCCSFLVVPAFRAFLIGAILAAGAAKGSPAPFSSTSTFENNELHYLLNNLVVESIFSRNLSLNKS